MDAFIATTGATSSKDKHVTIPTFQISQDETDYFSRPRRVHWPEHDEGLYSTSGDQGPGDLDIRREPGADRTGTETEPSIVTDFGEALYLYETNNYTIEKTTTSYSRPKSYDDYKEPLQEKLFEAIEATRQDMGQVGSDKVGFIPRQQQARIMTEIMVAQELARIEGFPGKLWFKRRIEKDTLAICASPVQHPVQVIDHKQKGKSFRRIFATLVCINRTNKIGKFIDEGVCDQDLPLEKFKAPGKATETLSLRRKSAPDVSLYCFKGWGPKTLVEFERYQWKLLAPYFSQVEKGKATHYELPDDTILPFTYQKHTHSGAHGEVLQVKIHPEHHNFEKYKDTELEQYFAVKRLRGAEKEFRNELRMLKRLSHNHLISLLATYQYLQHFHLIFHWAECDLRTYWNKKNPAPVHDIGTLLWMAQQCEGIADGIYRIHHHETNSVSSIIMGDSKIMSSPRSPRSPVATSPGLAHAPRIVFGRHGDIKPANLLWFPDLKNPNGRGTIKICDFGAGEFSTVESAPSASNSIAYSPSYRPPEFDLTNSIINNSYDIWTLGCLYLEFITWFMGGSKLLHEFQDCRRQSSSGWCHTNAFFETTSISSLDSNEEFQNQKARIKPAVLESIQRLRNHPKYSTFFAQFLDMIKMKMLIIEPSRISSHNLSIKLAELVENCEQNHVYGLGPLSSAVL